MGIVFNTKDIEKGTQHNSSSIKEQVTCAKSVIQRAPLKVLTTQNKQFLKSLGLKLQLKPVA